MMRVSLFNRIANRDFTLHDCIKERVVKIFYDNSHDDLHAFGDIFNIDDIRLNINNSNMIKAAVKFYRNKILHYEPRLSSIDIEIKDDRILTMHCILKNSESLFIEIIL